MGAEGVRVTSAEIARIAGVKPTAVSNWRRRHDDFPPPVAGTDRSPRFALSEVENWLTRHRGVPDIDPEQRLWQAVDSLRESAPADEILSWVGALLLHLHRGADPSAAASEDPVHLLHRAHEVLSHVVDQAGLAAPDASPPPAVPEQHVPGLVEAAVDAARQHGAMAAFERLLDRVEQRSPSGAHTLPVELADLMVQLARVAHGTVVDPICGRGDLLLAAARGGLPGLRGQDRDRASVWLAALRLAFLDTTPAAADLRVADALRSPAFPSGEADAALCAPPFSERNWGAEELGADSRWMFGTPPRLESDLAWVQHCLSQVRPGGPVVLLMPPAAAQRPSGRRIRRSLLSSGALRAVLALPPGLAAHYAVPLQLWVLARPGGTEGPPDPVLLSESSTLHGGAHDVAATTAEVVDLVTDVWEEFCAAPDGFTERPGRARTVPVIDLMDDQIDLTPRRYLPVPHTSARDHAAFGQDRQQVKSALRSLDTLLSELPEPSPGQEAAGVVTLGELARAGSVTIRRPSSRLAQGESGARIEARVVNGADFAGGAGITRTGEVDADPMRNPPIQEGDVLIPAVAPRPTARVATAAESGAYPGSGLYVVRTNPGALDPWFLAGCVTGAGESRHIARVSSSMRGQLRLDPARLRLPVLTVEEQRRQGERFRQVWRFREALQETLVLGEQLADRSFDLIAGQWETTDGSTSAH